VQGDVCAVDAEHAEVTSRRGAHGADHGTGEKAELHQPRRVGGLERRLFQHGVTTEGRSAKVWITGLNEEGTAQGFTKLS
jgi:hypothetical protein